MQTVTISIKKPFRTGIKFGAGFILGKSIFIGIDRGLGKTVGPLLETKVQEFITKSRKKSDEYSPQPYRQSDL